MGMCVCDKKRVGGVVRGRGWVRGMRVRDFVRVMCVVRVRSSAHANVTCGAMCVRACMYERMSGRVDAGR